MKVDPRLIYRFDSYDEFYDRMAHGEAQVCFVFAERGYLIEKDLAQDKKTKQRKTIWFVADCEQEGWPVIRFYNSLDEMLNDRLLDSKSINERFSELVFFD